VSFGSRLYDPQLLVRDRGDVKGLSHVLAGREPEDAATFEVAKRQHVWV